MKAKIKETGEIVNVDNLYDDGTALVNGEYINVSKLNFFETIDWEQRRYEIAKESLTAIMSNEDFYKQILFDSAETKEYYIPKCISQAAVCFADALIAQLKKTEEEKE